MLENSDSRKPVRYLLVLIVVVGLILVGWLTGHIVRHITPAYHQTPNEEVNPHIKTGYFFAPDGQSTIIDTVDGLGTRIYTGQEAVPLQIGCLNTTYYTSLPAKCHTPDGQLVEAGGFGPKNILIPKSK